MEILKNINSDEIRRIKEVERKAKKLHLPFQGYCTFSINVLDKEGKTKLQYNDLAKSWVRNMYNIIVHQMLAVGGTSPFSGYGEGKLGMPYNNNCFGGQFDGYAASAGDTTFGIVIGTSNATESFESYSLGALIQNGTSSGQMEYGTMTITSSWVSAEKRFLSVLVRNIANNSGATITVREMGVIGRYSTYNSSNPYLVCRDVLSPTVDVGNEEQIRITYNIYGPAFP